MLFAVADRNVAGTHGFAAMSPSGRAFTLEATVDPSEATVAEAAEPKPTDAHKLKDSPNTAVAFNIAAFMISLAFAVESVPYRIIF